MQMTRLGHAVGRIGERRAGGSRPEPAQAELAREQVCAEKAQRPREQEQQVVADQGGDGARAEECCRAVAEQRVREGEAERMRVEDVGVEQVQRVVQHRVPYPGNLPRGPHGIAEVGRDPAGQMQHQRPGREHSEKHPGECHPQDLGPTEGRRGRPG